MKHLKYLKYVVRHKWFVLIACFKCGVNPWRAVIHDWSKFLPSEWFGYADWFYGPWKKLKESEPDDFRYWMVHAEKDSAFKHAWNLHQKRNKHHWQYWTLINDSDNPQVTPLNMPEKYIREMVADWWGAGRAITGKWDALGWYKKQTTLLLTDGTRNRVEMLLEESVDRFPMEPCAPLKPYSA